jgi:hypothetical protein
MSATPLRLSGSGDDGYPAPLYGEHTRAVLLEECGYTEAEVREMEVTGLFGKAGLR